MIIGAEAAVAPPPESPGGQCVISFSLPLFLSRYNDRLIVHKCVAKLVGWFEDGLKKLTKLAQSGGGYLQAYHESQAFSRDYHDTSTTTIPTVGRQRV
jgi:hypothetical protein